MSSPGVCGFASAYRTPSAVSTLIVSILSARRMCILVERALKFTFIMGFVVSVDAGAILEDLRVNLIVGFESAICVGIHGAWCRGRTLGGCTTEASAGERTPP